ncbi:DUF6325 family protein [Cellulomonas sp. 179-A 4D5 NHS]|uniref:DUF6325 family protein n=1 Tax=Cellulomonas sp. 179-A 4D5 NHS TaxID=3142378 RepID=UPI0039A0300E
MTRVAVRALVHLVAAAAGLLGAAWLLDGDLTVTPAGFVVTVVALTVVLGGLQPLLGSLLLRLSHRGGAGRSPVTATPAAARRPAPPVRAPRATAGERHGPVEFVALAFSGERAPAAVTAELARLAADRRLGLIDVVVVRRRTRDELEVLPVEEVSTVAGVQELAVSQPGTVRGDDVAAMARDLTPGTSAVLVVFERRRARALVAAARDVEAAALAHHLVPFPLVPGQLHPPSASN